MKKIGILIVIFAAFACSREPEGYEIKVNLDGAEGSVLLERRSQLEWIPVDTAEITDGEAVLRGKVSFPEDHYLSVLGQRPKTVVFVENTRMTIEGKADSLQQVTVTGSRTHNEFAAVLSQIRKIEGEYTALYQEAREAATINDTAKVNQLLERLQEIHNSTNSTQEEFIRNNPSSYASPFFLMNVQANMDPEKLSELVSVLDPVLDSVPSIMVLKDRVEKLNAVAIGRTAPDFIMNDPGGNPIRFSDVYAQNEFTLLDFWAAWCGPCRVENPNIVSVFNDYKDEGFGVFGVSLDRDREAWLKAIENDNLTWTHVSDLSYWNNAAARMYVISSIPSSLIVDRNGIIVAKNKRDTELRETVADLLGK